MQRFKFLKFLAVTLSFAISILATNAFAQTNPEFKLGFKALAEQIPDIVGQPMENENYGPNGDSLQRTSNGLLVWRKADNWTAFTDGYRSWVNGPNGLQERLNDQRFDWEASTPPPTPTPTADQAVSAPPSASPSPTPTSPPDPSPTVNVYRVDVVQGEDLESGTIWVLGELRNEGTVPAYAIKVTAQLLSDSGDVVASATQAFTYLSPGDALGFRISLGKPVAFSKADVSVTSSSTYHASIATLHVAGSTMEKTSTDYGGVAFVWDSAVTNNSATTVTACTVYVWFLDEYDNVLWADTAYPAASLAPGTSASFTVRTIRHKYNPKVSGINQVRALAVGIQQP
ncbi:MAG: hypothetical protein ACOX87_11810 [Chloroflexota bacterium]|jgi:hypothetical protein